MATRGPHSSFGVGPYDGAGTVQSCSRSSEVSPHRQVCRTGQYSSATNSPSWQKTGRWGA